LLNLVQSVAGSASCLWQSIVDNDCGALCTVQGLVCNAGHAGVIQQLLRRGFHLTVFDDVDDVENLLMMSDQLHDVSMAHV